MTWACYSAVIGIGAGAWLGDHTLVAVGVGVIGGLALGLVIDWVLRHLTRHRGAEQAGPAPATTVARGRARARDGPPGHRTLTIGPRRLTIRYRPVIDP